MKENEKMDKQILSRYIEIFHYWLFSCIGKTSKGVF